MTAPTSKLGSTQALLIGLPAGSAAKAKTEVQRPDPLIAPIAKSQGVGQLEVMVEGKALASLPLFALEAVPQTNWFGRTWDALRLWMK